MSLRCVAEYLSLPCRAARRSPGMQAGKLARSRNAAANRADEVLGISVSLSTVLFKKFSVSTFFSFADNQSDDEFYAYETRQFGFHIGYRF